MHECESFSRAPGLPVGSPPDFQWVNQEKYACSIFSRVFPLHFEVTKTTAERLREQKMQGELETFVRKFRAIFEELRLLVNQNNAHRRKP